MNTIISKRPTPFTYTKYFIGNGFIKPEYSIIVNGGAGIVGGSELLSGRPSNQRSLFVPDGVATEIDNDTLDKLMAIKKFKKDIERGLIVVLKNQTVTDQDKINSIAEKDMLADDEISGRPLTEEDVKNAGGVVNEDGSININKSKGDPAAMRKALAGHTFSQKKQIKKTYRAKVQKA